MKIIERYVDLMTADKLGDMGIKDYMSLDQMRLYPFFKISDRYLHPPKCYYGEVPEDPRSNEVIICPPDSLVSRFLLEVYNIFLEITSSFGDKVGYDMFEVIGYTYQINVIEKGACYLEYDDNKFFLSSKYCNNRIEEDYYAEEFKKTLYNNPTDALHEAVERGVIIAHDKGQSGPYYKNLMLQSEEDAKAKALKEKKLGSEDRYPYSVIFSSALYGLHSHFTDTGERTEDGLAIYRRGQCKIGVCNMFGDFRVQSGEGPESQVYMGKICTPIWSKEDLLRHKRLLERDGGL